MKKSSLHEKGWNIGLLTVRIFLLLISMPWGSVFRDRLHCGPGQHIWCTNWGQGRWSTSYSEWDSECVWRFGKYSGCHMLISVTHLLYFALDTSHFQVRQCITRELSTGVCHLLFSRTSSLLTLNHGTVGISNTLSSVICQFSRTKLSELLITEQHCF